MNAIVNTGLTLDDLIDVALRRDAIAGELLGCKSVKSII